MILNTLTPQPTRVDLLLSREYQLGRRSTNPAAYSQWLLQKMLPLIVAIVIEQVEINRTLLEGFLMSFKDACLL